MVHVAIIGAGDAGARRLQAIPAGALVAVHDLNRARAEELVRLAGTGRVMDSVLDAVHNPKVDAVIVATVHAGLGEAALAAIKAGKHVFIEAPAARTPGGIQQLRDAAERESVLVRVGYNLRYHPAVRRAHEMMAAGEIGLPLYVRGRFGHGGWPGFARDWRANPKLAGGGLLMHHGAALIDLSRWFLGEIATTRATLGSLYWETPVEDNAFLELTSARGQTAWLHAGATEWKPVFSYEIVGREGKLEISGLGGMYGPERLTHYRRPAEAAQQPEALIHEYPDNGAAWEDEITAFLDDIAAHRIPEPGLADAQAVLRVIHEAYRQNDDDAPDPSLTDTHRVEEVHGRHRPFGRN